MRFEWSSSPGKKVCRLCLEDMKSFLSNVKRVFTNFSLLASSSLREVEIERWIEGNDSPFFMTIMIRTFLFPHISAVNWTTAASPPSIDRITTSLVLHQPLQTVSQLKLLEAWIATKKTFHEKAFRLCTRQRRLECLSAIYWFFSTALGAWRCMCTEQTPTESSQHFPHETQEIVIRLFLF